MRVAGDVDIDFPNRNAALNALEHITASLIKNEKLEKHNTGVYFHAVPVDPITRFSSIPYDVAEDKGWFKIDLLNVGVYEEIKDEAHLIHLMDAPLNWQLFEFPEFTSKLIHLSNHADLVAKLKPTSVKDLAMVLALIRPGKRHLINKCVQYGFESIEPDIWTETTDGTYSFKKAHSLSYAMLVKVHANLLIEQTID